MNKREQMGGWQEGVVLNFQRGRKGFRASAGESVELIERVRTRALFGVLYLALALVIARLIYLQVFSGGQHILLSQNNHLENEVVYAPRGIIWDREGEKLVENTGNEPGQRRYILGGEAGHLLGYVAETREKELGCREGICYHLGEWIGRSGAEKTLENLLKGKDGGVVKEVNAAGQVVRNLGGNEPEKGQDVYLSIDLELQKVVAHAMKERVGSVTAIDLSGKVLALYSSPTFDPNLFTVNRDEEMLAELLADAEAQIFLDRVISGTYAPGSVFKLVVAYAGLASGKITGETLIEDTGEIRIEQYRYGNWYFDQYGRKEGEVNLVKALSRSNDIYFYKAGEMMGVDEIVKWTKKFGYGEKTGIELPGEAVGIVPSRIGKERATGEKWFLGNTYHLSIGQGDLTATPLQVARATAGAVSGRLCKISILKDSQVSCENLGLTPEMIETVKEGMRGACAIGGTAFPFFDFEPSVLCKTGTAQHAGQGTNKESEVKPHAWITVAYPAENPRLILTVMLESAGEGSAEAGPVAKEILTAWREMEN